MNGFVALFLCWVFSQSAVASVVPLEEGKYVSGQNLWKEPLVFVDKGNGWQLRSTVLIGKYPVPVWVALKEGVAPTGETVLQGDFFVSLPVGEGICYPRYTVRVGDAGVDPVSGKNGIWIEEYGPRVIQYHVGVCEYLSWTTKRHPKPYLPKTTF